jgi:tetratricopeptide (TPR) repeat protein
MASRPQVFLFGQPEVKCSGEPISLAAKEVALLALLTHRFPKGLGRRYLAELLWPDSDLRSALHSLSQALYGIRRKCGDDIVLASRKGQVRLGHVHSDVVAFQRACAHGDSHTAAGLYRGSFAEGFSVDGCVHFEQQLDAARAHYSRKALSLFEDPLTSNTRLQLGRALRLTAEPATSNDPGDSRTPGTCFVGRAVEINLMDGIWKDVQSGSSRVVLIEGEAGIGKTALGERFFKKTVLRGARGLRAAGYSLEANLPYGLLARLLADMSDTDWLAGLEHPWSAILSSVQPNLQAHAPAEDVEPSPQRLAAALQRAVQHATSHGPVTIFIDDIQWVDPASAAILHYLGHSAFSFPLMQIWSRRTTEPPDSDLAFPTAEVIRLGGLTPEDLGYVVSTKRPELADDGLISDIYHLSQGNPLLLFALLEGEFPPSQLPPSAKKYFRNEVESLPTAAREVGAALGAADASISTECLATLLDSPSEVVVEALNDLNERGYLLTEPKGQYRFRHHLVAEVFLEAASPATRAALHGRVGRLLRGLGRAPAIVATQFAIGGNAAEAYQTAISAAKGGERLHAFAEAEHFYRIAVAHSADVEQQADAKYSLARLLIDQTRPGEAIELLEPLLLRSLPGERAAKVRVLRELAALKSESRSASYLRRAHQAIRGFTEIAPRDLVLDALLEIGISGIDIGERAFAQSVADHVSQFIESIPEETERTAAEVRLLALSALLQRPENSRLPLKQLLARLSNSPSAQVRCYLASGIIDLLHGNMEDAETALLDALAICERYALEDQKNVVAIDLGVAYLEQGRWSEAERQFDKVSQAAPLKPRRELLSVSNNLAILRWESGDFELAARAGEKCIQLGTECSAPRTRFLGLAIFGLASLELGSLSEARYAERELRISLPIGQWWGNDISYSELLLARTAALNSRIHEALTRLEAQTEFSASLDFYCAARLEVEVCRLKAAHDPTAVLMVAEPLRCRLQRARAVPLVERLDGIITRCRSAISD